MKSEQWEKVKELFEAAQRYESLERRQFLEEACGDDLELREEVSSLLASYEQAGSFIAAQAIEDAAHLLVDVASGPVCGRLIDRYRLIALLGKGGMGEVYLATDTELGREVALKLLPAEFIGDPERVKRFEREARVASSLNHPNILTIHEIGRNGDTLFIATELIKGQTLRQRLAAGPINLTEAVNIAIQIGAALEAARGAGIAHRDIKPENVMLRPDGYVKVLDFGLAKPFDAPINPSGFSSKPRQDSYETAPGALIGTFRYMSPEQARGQKVDHRSDIWSLGVTLYEMMVGAAPFDGETPSDVIVAILAREPAPIEELDEPELQKIISRALEKDIQQRYQTAGDLLGDLQDLKRKLERRSEVVTYDEIQAPKITIAVKAIGTDRIAGGGRRKRLLAMLVILLSILAISTILAAFVRSTRPLWGLTTVRSEPPERVIRYSLTVQKMRDGKPIEGAFEASGREAFESGWMFRLRLVSPQAGHLYLLNEGPASDGGINFRILFPIISINQGSTFLPANEAVLTGWYVFDERPGIEKFWVVWTPFAVSELEAVREKVNHVEKGVLSNPTERDSIRNWLAHQSTNNAQTTTVRDDAVHQTIVRGRNEVLISLIELEHRSTRSVALSDRIRNEFLFYRYVRDGLRTAKSLRSSGCITLTL